MAPQNSYRGLKFQNLRQIREHKISDLKQTAVNGKNNGDWGPQIMGAHKRPSHGIGCHCKVEEMSWRQR